MVLVTCPRLEQLLHKCFYMLMGGGLVFGLDTTRVCDLFMFFLDCVPCDIEVRRWC
jgi:hypothetical protein